MWSPSPVQRARHRAALLVAAVALGLAGAVAPSSATVPPPSAERLLVGGTEHMIAKESALGRDLDVVRTYATWSPTSLPVLDLAQLRDRTGGGRRSLFLSALIPWTSWKATADQANGDDDPTNDLPVPYCRWGPTHPQTGQPLAKSWFRAFADGDYDTRLRTWLSDVNALGAPGSNPVLLSLMPEADRLDALPSTVPYRACVGTPEEFRAGWSRAYAVAGGAAGGQSLNAADGAGGRLVWVPVFTGWSFNYTPGYGAPERALVEFRTGRPPPSAPPDEATLEASRATPWLPPTGTWDHVGIDEFNFSGAIAGRVVPARIKVDDPATPQAEADQWRSLEVLMRPVLLWSTHHAPQPDGVPGTVLLAEVGSVPDPTRPERRPSWIEDACTYLATAPRVVGSLYFDTNTVRLSSWAWTKHADGSWHAAPNPTGTDHASVAAWGELMASPRAGGTTDCGEPVPPPDEVEWVGNGGVEASLAGWAGRYGASPTVTRTSGGHDSNWAITVRATSSTPSSAGVSDQPRWVSSTVAGTTYVASAWVQTGVPNERITLQLREWAGQTMVASQRVEWRATGTGWHELSVPLTAARSGGSLSLAVYAPYVAAPRSFSIDDLSLTSTESAG